MNTLPDIEALSVQPLTDITYTVPAQDRQFFTAEWQRALTPTGAGTLLPFDPTVAQPPRALSAAYLAERDAKRKRRRQRTAHRGDDDDADDDDDDVDDEDYVGNATPITRRKVLVSPALVAAAATTTSASSSRTSSVSHTTIDTPTETASQPSVKVVAKKQKHRLLDVSNSRESKLCFVISHSYAYTHIIDRVHTRTPQKTNLATIPPATASHEPPAALRMLAPVHDLVIVPNRVCIPYAVRLVLSLTSGTTSISYTAYFDLSTSLFFVLPGSYDFYTNGTVFDSSVARCGHESIKLGHLKTYTDRATPFMFRSVSAWVNYCCADMRLRKFVELYAVERSDLMEALKCRGTDVTTQWGVLHGVTGAKQKDQYMVYSKKSNEMVKVPGGRRSGKDKVVQVFAIDDTKSMTWDQFEAKLTAVSRENKIELFVARGNTKRATVRLTQLSSRTLAIASDSEQSDDDDNDNDDDENEDGKPRKRSRRCAKNVKTTKKEKKDDDSDDGAREVKESATTGGGGGCGGDGMSIISTSTNTASTSDATTQTPSRSGARVTKRRKPVARTAAVRRSKKVAKPRTSSVTTRSATTSASSSPSTPPPPPTTSDVGDATSERDDTMFDNVVDVDDDNTQSLVHASSERVIATNSRPFNAQSLFDQFRPTRVVCAATPPGSPIRVSSSPRPLIGTARQTAFANDHVLIIPLPPWSQLAMQTLHDGVCNQQWLSPQLRTLIEHQPQLVDEVRGEFRDTRRHHIIINKQRVDPLEWMSMRDAVNIGGWAADAVTRGVARAWNQLCAHGVLPSAAPYVQYEQAADDPRRFDANSKKLRRIGQRIVLPDGTVLRQWGVQTLVPIRAGEVVGVYNGYVMRGGMPELIAEQALYQHAGYTANEAEDAYAIEGVSLAPDLPLVCVSARDAAYHNSSVVAYINCCPPHMTGMANCEFDRNSQVIRATHFLRRGQMLCINYGESYYTKMQQQGIAIGVPSEADESLPLRTSLATKRRTVSDDINSLRLAASGTSRSDDDLSNLDSLAASGFFDDDIDDFDFGGALDDDYLNNDDYTAIDLSRNEFDAPPRQIHRPANTDTQLLNDNPSEIDLDNLEQTLDRFDTRFDALNVTPTVPVRVVDKLLPAAAIEMSDFDVEEFFQSSAAIAKATTSLSRTV